MAVCRSAAQSGFDRHNRAHDQVATALYLVGRTMPCRPKQVSKRRRVLIERARIVEHSSHVSDPGHVPVADVLVEGSEGKPMRLPAG